MTNIDGPSEQSRSFAEKLQHIRDKATENLIILPATESTDPENLPLIK